MKFLKRIAPWIPALLVLWFLWDSIILRPARIYAVMLHEYGHALAAILTGGEVLHIRVFTSEGGDCVSRGGIRWIITSAGYLGNLFLGALLLKAGVKSRKAPRGMVLLGVVTLLVTALLVRNFEGVIFCSAIGTLLVLCGLKAPEWISKKTLVSLGLINVLYPLWDMRSDILSRPHERSDARILAEYVLGTSIPALTTWLTIIIGCVWIVVGGFVACTVLYGTSKKRDSTSE